jgi:hypothetical protein
MKLIEQRLYQPNLAQNSLDAWFQKQNQAWLDAVLCLCISATDAIQFNCIELQNLAASRCAGSPSNSILIGHLGVGFRS